MGKLDDYAAGRAHGMKLALDIAKKDGLEELEKEIRFRNVSGINVALSKKELDKACEKIKMRTLDTVLVLAVATMRDEFGYGRKRLQQFIDRFGLKAECLVDDMATWDDYIKMIKEETGIEMAIREDKDEKKNR